ncbi:hypothetical protein V8C86DRAFT_2803749, partial [Haematococcus lacustris]
MVEVVTVYKQGTETPLETFELPANCAEAWEAMTTLYGAGVLKWTNEGRTMTLSKSRPDLPSTGKLEWHQAPSVAAPAEAAAGAQHLGQSTFRRGITQLEAEVEAYNKQLREDMARIQNELADIRRQMEDGALPKWWVLGLRLIFVNAGPLACVAYQLTVEEQGTSVWATSMYSLLAQAVQMILWSLLCVLSFPSGSEQDASNGLQVQGS